MIQDSKWKAIYESYNTFVTAQNEKDKAVKPTDKKKINEDLPMYFAQVATGKDKAAADTKMPVAAGTEAAPAIDAPAADSAAPEGNTASTTEPNKEDKLQMFLLAKIKEIADSKIDRGFDHLLQAIASAEENPSDESRIATIKQMLSEIFQG